MVTQSTGILFYYGFSKLIYIYITMSLGIANSLKTAHHYNANAIIVLQYLPQIKLESIYKNNYSS